MRSGDGPDNDLTDDECDDFLAVADALAHLRVAAAYGSQRDRDEYVKMIRAINRAAGPGARKCFARSEQVLTAVSRRSLVEAFQAVLSDITERTNGKRRSVSLTDGDQIRVRLLLGLVEQITGVDGEKARDSVDAAIKDALRNRRRKPGVTAARKCAETVLGLGRDAILESKDAALTPGLRRQLPRVRLRDK